MAKTSFDPIKHGFKFANSFVNALAKLPGGEPIDTQGRCGGMAYASLDYYHHHLQVPANPSLPPDGTLLADYIYKRLFDSFATPSAANFVAWTLHSDHSTMFFKGVSRWSKEDEFPRLRQRIDAGAPQVLGLVLVTDLMSIGFDHQVVAYGYEDDGAGNLTIYLYDNRYPRQEVRLWTTPDNEHWTLSRIGEDQDWRGFFVQDYAPQLPDYLRDGTLLKEESHPEVYVVYGGGKFWIPSPEEFEALGFSWDSIRTVADGSLAWVADLPSDGTLLAERGQPEVYVMENGQRRWITSPALFESRGYAWDQIRVIPAGGLAGCPIGPSIEPAPPTPGPATPARDTMQPGQVLYAEDSLTSLNGNYRFTYQGDGNLVLYNGDTPLWASGTYGTAAGVCVMQNDGNLVLYPEAGQPVWSSNTSQHPDSRLVVQDDGNAVIYSPDDTAVWATNTA